MQLKIFYKAFPETQKCPSCGAVGRIRRSRSKNIKETLIKATQVIGIYKCRDCGWRGLLKRITFTRYSFITLMFYCGLIFMVAYIINKVLAKNFGGD